MRRRQILAQAGETRPVSIPEKKIDPVEEYARVFGKKPHWKMKPETILERLKDGHPS